MTNILEDFAAALDDEDAWDMLARLGWRLVDVNGGVETWESQIPDGGYLQRSVTRRSR